MKLKSLFIAAGMALPCVAFAQTQQVLPIPGVRVDRSQIVPQVATDIFPSVINANAGLRVRLVLRDTAIDSGTTSAVTIWCAKGTAASNPAVIGSNGFPLNSGIDDTGNGVYQGAVNCIQAASQTHYAQLEQY